MVMTDKSNCSTCPNRKPAKEGYDKRMSYCEILKLHFTYPITCSNETMYSLQEYGLCLSHPHARAYLMRDVIEELERREKIFGGDYGVAYRAAILLINGVR